MLKTTFGYTLTLLLILCLSVSKVGLVYASDQPSQISHQMEGLTFNFPFIINNALSNLLFSFLLKDPYLYIQLQPASTPDLITSSQVLDSTSSLVMVVTPTPIPPTPTMTATPTPTPILHPITFTSSKPSLNADKIFDLVNNHRQRIGLPLVQKNDQVCAVANSRAPELANEFASGNLHQGVRARHLPYFNHENIIQTTSEQAALAGWLSDDIHRAGIEGNYKYSCVACSANNCVQEFTNLVLK